MTAIDVQKLVEWLGPDGAIGGLERSNLTIEDLCKLASRYGVSVEQKMRRTDIINEIINGKLVRIDKTIDELLAMDHGNLKELLENRKVSRTELLSLLTEFDIYPGSEAKKNLVEFAAREISDLGMYERVAKGRRA